MPPAEVEAPAADVVEDIQITSTERPQAAEEAAIAEVEAAPRTGTEIENEEEVAQ